MYDLRTIAIDDPWRLRVCKSVTWLRYANPAKRMDVLLGVETFGDLRNVILDGSPDFRHGFDAAFAR